MITAIIAGRLGIVSSSANALIQAILDGQFSTFEVFEGNYPHPETDPLRLTATITGAILNSATLCTPTWVNSQPAALADTDEDTPKYARLSGSGGEFFLSLGLSSNDFNAQLVINKTGWVLGDKINLTALQISAVDEDIDHIDVQISNTSPKEGIPYTANCRVKNAANANLNRIGRVITTTLTTVSGAGGGSVAATSISNRYGVFEPLSITPGAVDTQERLDVEDQSGFTGSGAVATVQEANAALVFTHAGVGGAAGSAYSIGSVVIDAGNWILVNSTCATSNAPNAPAATELIFSLLTRYDDPVSGITLAKYAAPCSAGFSGTVNFPGATAGLQASSHILEVAPSKPISSLECVAGNIIPLSKWDGSSDFTVPIIFDTVFSDPNNGADAVYLSYAKGTSTPADGWNEHCDFSLDSIVRFVVHSRSDEDVGSIATYGASGQYVIGLLAELAGIPA